MPVSAASAKEILLTQKTGYLPKTQYFFPIPTDDQRLNQNTKISADKTTERKSMRKTLIKFLINH